MADTMVFALIGSLIVTLTLLPVLCAWFMRRGVRERRNPAFEAIRSAYVQGPGLLPRPPLADTARGGGAARRRAAAHRRASAPSSCRSSTRARCGCAPPCPTPSRSTRRRRSRRRSATCCSSFPEVTTVASELGRPDDGTDSTGFFNVEFYVGLKPYSQWTRRLPQQGGADRGHQSQARGLPRHHLQLHAAGRRRGRRGGDRPEERARGEGLRSRPRHAAAEGQGDQADPGAGARHPRRDPGAGARPAEPHDHASTAPRSPATVSTSPTSTP